MKHVTILRSVIGLLVAVSAVAVFASTRPAQGVAPPPVSGIGLVDPSQGLWHLRNGSDEVTSFFFGNPSDYPMMGDWDCDGVDTPGMYRQSDGYVYLRNSNTQGIADIRFFFGNPGDIPIVGDFNGDGCDTVSIYRPSEGRAYIINKLGENEGGLGAADYAYYFGNPGDKPFTGDFNGDGIDTLGLHRESTGRVYFRFTNTQGVADRDFIYGDPGDRIVAGDWNGDGKDSPALFRPSNHTLYFRYTNTQGVADDEFTMGGTDFVPISGDFGPLTATANVSLSGATPGLTHAVEALYMWGWGAAEIPEGLRTHLGSVYPRNRHVTVTGSASTDTVDGTEVGVVTTDGGDVILAVSDEDDHWRVVGAKLPSLSVPTAWYGDSPRLLLVIGGDARPGSDPLTSNGDSEHIIMTNPQAGEGVIVGIPRDTYLDVSYGTGIDKWAITMRGRGPQSTLNEARAVTGLPIEGYIVTAFADFTSLIDAYDGLGYLGFWAKLPYSVWGNGDPTKTPCVEGGVLTLLDGQKALCAAIERYTLPSGDVDRQLDHGAEMLWAMDKAQALGIDDLPRLLKILSSFTTTDLSVEDLFTLAASSYEMSRATLPNIVVQGDVTYECQVNHEFLNPFPGTDECVDQGGEVVYGWRFTQENLAVFTDIADGRLDTTCLETMNPDSGVSSPGPCWMRPPGS